MSWRKVRLGDIGRVAMCKRVLKGHTAASGDIPFYKIGTFGGEANAFISSELYESLKSKYSYPQKGNVLISAAGTIGKVVLFDGCPSYFQDSNIVWLEHNGDYLSDRYLYYFLLKHEWQITQGATIQRLYNEDIRNTEINLPPLPVQRKIADILGAYDDLIENNRRRIALLERMARELYRERFCRRKYIANKIAIGELIVENAKSKIKAGDCKGGVGNIPFFTSGSSIYWCNDGLVDGVNLYLNTGGSSDVKIHNGEASYSTDTWSISSDKDIVYFLFHYLKSLSDSGELFSSYFKGATIQHLQKRDFRKHVISVPEPNDLSSFNALVIPMHLAADNFKKQNQRLCSSRDRLLPRLMSGKIDLDKLVKGEEVENG